MMRGVLEMKKNLILAISASVLLSCSGSGSSFKPIKTATPADLSLQQENALVSVSSSFGLSLTEVAGNGFSSETLALQRSESNSKSFASAFNESLEDSFSETRNCETSGQILNAGTYQASITNDNTPNRVDFRVNADSTIEAQDCENADATLDGSLEVNLDMRVLIRDVFQAKTLVDGAMSWTGGLTAQGRDAEGVLQNVSMTFNDLRLRIFFDTEDSDTLNAFINLYFGAADNELRLNMLREIMECSGNMVIDDTTYSCESVFATLLAAES